MSFNSNIEIFLEEFPSMFTFLKLAAISVLVASISAIAMAQSTVTGAIGGTVTNPAKEVVTGASITVKNTGTNKEETGATDREGRFRIPNLEPGEYGITINASGFAPFTQAKIIVEVGRETTLDVPLS